MKFFNTCKFTFVLIVVLVAFTGTQLFAQDLVPIDIKLPKPMFIGTPQNMQAQKMLPLENQCRVQMKNRLSVR